MASVNSDAFLALDEEMRQDFVDCYNEAVEDIEGCINRMEKAYSAAGVDELFRALHSLKGNCAMVFMEPLVDVVHILEEVVDAVRKERAPWRSLYGNLILEGIERLGQVRDELLTGDADPQHYFELLDAVQLIQKAEYAQHDELIAGWLGLEAEVSYPAEAEPEPEIAQPPQTLQAVEVGDKQADLALFHDWAERLDNLSLFRNDRSSENLKLAYWLNEELDLPVEPDQLEAAVLLHDLGMALIPHAIFNKQAPLSRDEQRQMADHVDFGAQLLERFGHWQEAAVMVRQHHERWDGKGYPMHLAGEDIHIGAQILAICDAYLAMTTERSDRTFKKSLLTAVADINRNKGLQFADYVVDAFNNMLRNKVIRREG
ncbi:HD domain-containing phosphohydrolase [Balneatrix alpica]|uniref:HD domain-containing phosphohydrolase n=1 Tax=Balneatrix alpica TaxID=75684 RepID=A0ABV5Z8B3_9GAMM|nr:HD domain-containing phosphohydrolase [Balneatrix alpica]